MADLAYCLPEYLVVPARAALAFRVNGDLTGRDISFMVAGLWLAANTDCWQENSSEHHWRIPDNGLRHALGYTRRISIDEEDARHARLKDAKLHFDHGYVQAPYAVTRNNLDDNRSWFIPRRLVDFWRVIPGEPVIYMPRMLLAKARGRYSVGTYLHAMAIAAGIDPSYGVVTRKGDDRFTLAIDHVAYLESFFRVPAERMSLTLHRLKDEIPAEIDKDLPGWADTVIEVDTRMSSSPKHPRGRFVSAKIHVIHVPVAELEARAKGSETWMAPVRTSVPGWEKRPPRPRHLRAPAGRPPPAPIADVAIIAPEPELPMVRVPRKGEPGYIQYNDDEDIAF